MAEILGILLAFAIWLVLEVIGYGVTYLVLKLLFWCFNLSHIFTWKIALGVYLVLSLLKWIHNDSTKVTIKKGD